MQPAHQPPELALHKLGFLPEYLLMRYLELEYVHRLAPRQIATPRQSYVLQDAIRVLGVKSHDTDPFGLTGHVSPTRTLLERGFRLGKRRLSWGRYHFDMELGFLVHPLANADSSGARPCLRDD